jgi:hypothetical protein
MNFWIILMEPLPGFRFIRYENPPYVLEPAKVLLSASQEVSEMITRIRNLKSAICMKSLNVLLTDA